MSAHEPRRTNRKLRTRWSVKAADAVAGLAIPAGGILVILAVFGVAVFLVWVAVPLFLPSHAEEGQAADAPSQTAPAHVVVDDLSILGWAYYPDGKLRLLRVDTGEVIRELNILRLVKKDALQAFDFFNVSEEAKDAWADPGGDFGDGRYAAMAFDGGLLQVIGTTFKSAYLQDADKPEGLSPEKAMSACVVRVEKRVPKRAADGTQQRETVERDYVYSPDVDHRSKIAELQQAAEEAGATSFEASVVHGAIQLTPMGQARLQDASVKPVFRYNVRNIDGEAISAVAINGSVEPRLAVATESGRILLVTVKPQKSMMTEKITYRFQEVELPRASSQQPAGAPAYLRISALGDTLYAVWRDGRAVRYSIRDTRNPAVAEQGLDFVPDEGEEVTSLRFAAGGVSLVVGASNGTASVWFPAEVRKAAFDQRRMVRARQFEGGAAVTALWPAYGERFMAAGHADGRVRVLHVTSGKEMLDLETEDSAVDSIVITPRNDYVFAFGREKMWRWQIEPGYPAATVATLFTPVWYEGYEEPKHMYQSDSGEPKYGMWPLVFGTLKGTFYAMLFGVPIALLAAIYTSEFLHPRLKSKIKPTIELMASLPSVVLGFLAAMVFALIVEQWIATTLASFVAVPYTLLLAAHLWQLLDAQSAAKWDRYRLLFVFLALPVGVLMAVLLGPLMESLLFDGDLKAWLREEDGERAALGAWPGWFVLMIPLGAMAVVWANAEFVMPRQRLMTGDWDRRRVAILSLIKLAAGTVLVLAVAALVALVVSLLFDPRDSFLGGYDRTNALVVGIMMGFAIVPIIYTLADDALSSVPDHLRSGSLSAGATPWQTAKWIVVPAATSGLFSAVMIGLGRAVGETMIVLMAAGGVPVLEMNPFSGMRTLSANIAIELSEAPSGTAHYRILFLSGLVLFMMTSVLNTAAEVVRLRFRKRASQL